MSGLAAGAGDVVVALPGVVLGPPTLMITTVFMITTGLPRYVRGHGRDHENLGAGGPAHQ
jgi:hypothetical protein